MQNASKITKNNSQGIIFVIISCQRVNINKFAGLSRDWVGAKKLFMCFFGSFLMGEKKHINKIPPKIPGQSREMFVYVFFSLCVFSLPMCAFPRKTRRFRDPAVLFYYRRIFPTAVVN